jgi:arylsulfatase A-like enzyme
MKASRSESSRSHKRWGRLMLCALVLTMAGCGAGSDKPNVLLIVLDDFGYNDLAINNGSDSPTPTLDEVASKGVRFTRHYAESSCTASRVALLTGLYPARVGAHPDLSGIDQEFVTLPDRLGENGYTNYMIGKWHAGDAQRESRPEYQGFHHWFGFINQLYLRETDEQGNYQRSRPTYYNPWLETETEGPQPQTGHLTDILTDHAIAVAAEEEKPWFMYLSYYAPHTPIEPAAQYAAGFTDDAAGRYQALKAQLDANIGRLLSALDASGKLKNTMVIVVSDNGATARHWPSNLPYIGSKPSYTEGGVRTPLLLFWPGHWPAGTQRDDAVMIFDVYPTILAALGIDITADLDGRDIFSPAPERELRWYSGGRGFESYSMLTSDGGWRLFTWKSVVELLQKESDFVISPAINRAEEEPGKTTAMRASMQQWIESITRVTGLTRTDSEGFASFYGYAFRRTPVTGARTIGFTFKRGVGESTDSGRQQLVQQQGYIDISEAEGKLKVVVDGETAELELPLDTGSCMSIVVTNIMVKDNMIIYRATNTSAMRVYVNGQELAHSEYANELISQESPHDPLQVNISSQQGWYMPATATPFLSTRALSAATVKQDIDPALRDFCREEAVIASSKVEA